MPESKTTPTLIAMFVLLTTCPALANGYEGNGSVFDLDVGSTLHMQDYEGGKNTCDITIEKRCYIVPDGKHEVDVDKSGKVWIDGKQLLASKPPALPSSTHALSIDQLHFNSAGP
jgi:hypothetical protein